MTCFHGQDLGAERELTASLALIGVLVCSMFLRICFLGPYLCYPGSHCLFDSENQVYLGLLQLGLGGIPWIIMSEVMHNIFQASETSKT